jgi:hypothetical protein
VREVVAGGTTTKSVGCKVLFRSGRQNRHNLYDTKMSLFVSAVTDRYKKL